MLLLIEQQFEPRWEGEADPSVTPAKDLEEAEMVLRADGVVCERAGMSVTRLGPSRPQPIR
ncbi:hypothetical protein [Azospirillum sp. SYSU D00513]|uniref:hypothetical protein n=1 Tax=Azospirillum sp. SYSU D00513 TaxID=2812561 RepID=UPI001A96FA73|nr:hypothetical protein [Azospirillum sp. SYSU D00513]